VDHRPARPISHAYWDIRHMKSSRQINRRQHERFKLQAMYTAVVARPKSDVAATQMCGHAYDISAGGVRIELNEPLEIGESADLQMSLPAGHKRISASADVVWTNDEEEDPGPCRMALRFTQFQTPADRNCLLRWLGSTARRIAA
jgi:c-di-GMP-binding flagellar brake protein YcgR